MYKQLSYVVVTLSVSFLAACGTTTDPPTASTSSTPTTYPSVPPAFTGLPTERPHTKVLTTFAARQVTSYSADGRIAFNTKALRPTRAPGELHPANTDTPDQLPIGTILVSPPTEEAPYGFLRRVESVSVAPDGTAIITTSDASLQEAIAGADIQPEDVQASSVQVPVEVTLAPSRPEALTEALPKQLSKPSSTVRVQPQWDIPVAENPSSMCQVQSTPLVGGATLDQTGCIRFKLWATVDVDIGWWWIFPYLKGFGARMNGFASADVKTNLTTLNVDTTLATINLPGNFDYTLVSVNPGVVTFWVGPIPVVIAPQLGLKVKMNQGQISLKANASAKLTSVLPGFTFTLGTQIDPLRFGFYCGNTVNNGYWGCLNINNLNEKFEALKSQLGAWSPTSTPIGSEINTQLNLDLSYNGELGIQAGIYLYGALGLGASLQPYITPRVGLSVGFNGIPSPTTARTEVYGRIDGGINGEITAGLHLLFINLDTTLARGTLVPPRTIATLMRSCWTISGRC
jgi:hypothetical protein